MVECVETDWTWSKNQVDLKFKFKYLIWRAKYINKILCKYGLDTDGGMCGDRLDLV